MSYEKVMGIVNHKFKQKVKELIPEEVTEEQGSDGGNFPSSLSFDKSTSKFASGMARVDKPSLMDTLEFGNTNDGEGEALIIYNQETALPHKYTEVASEGNVIPKFSVEDSLQNCEGVNVININPKNNKCLAIVGQYESYHVQRLLRVNPKSGGPLNSEFDLMPVSRAYAENGRQNFVAPSENDLNQNWKILSDYFNNLDSVKAELEPLAKKIAKNNAIIVLTCNFGQSELLMNFACSARARGFDLSNVLVFATDIETKELAESLGINAFFDKWNFRDMPKKGAQRYGDKIFSKMMVAKTLCVQLINMLGYDLIFQDVDIVWWRNPLEYFENHSKDGYDMYFQDDGARTLRYAPLSANSGFYFVRSNPKTRYLFTSLLYSGDAIFQSHSHQQVLIARMNEHISLFNLRVKVMSREEHWFPGGFHYHRKKNFMKDVIQDKVHPYIFHMSWTTNKDYKLKFFQQMGEWFVNEKCVGKTKADILTNKDNIDKDGALSLVQPCCLREPEITCWYRDKPSKIPCNEAPYMDENGESFW